MEFFVTLWREAQQSYTPLVLLLALVSFVLTRWVAIDKPRFKAMFFFVAAHLICLIATAAFETVGSTELAAMLRTP
ncbi:MAG TPA: hypothetical protein VGD87_16120, partial [Archangium sp.]